MQQVVSNVSYKNFQRDGVLLNSTECFWSEDSVADFIALDVFSLTD